MRINKYLAECGLASRRNSEKFITEGRVKINGKPCELGSEVRVGKDFVTVDGKEVSPPSSHLYYMLNKPKGVVTTTSDERGRKTVLDFVKVPEGRRVYPIGRLDYDTEGLIILTTDGDLANALMHPKNEVGKTYIVNVEGIMLESELAVLRAGVVIDGEKTGRAKVKMLGMKGSFSRVEITIYEGKNREIRRMFDAIGRKIDFLKRIKVGEIRLGGLSRGECRELTAKEIELLKRY